VAVLRKHGRRAITPPVEAESKRGERVEPSAEQFLRLYMDMVRSRAFEEMTISQVYAGKIPSTWMSGIGQEGIVGAVGQLRPDDYITYTHRGAYCLICRGMEPGKILAELFGKRTGYCKGKGGRHIADLEHGVFGKSGTIGGHAPIAVGLATAIDIRGGDQVVMSFFGDGASNRGTTHESMNMAAVWKLPIVWVCENNGYAGLSPVSMSTAVSDLSNIAGSYGIPGVTVDGNDVPAVFEAAREAIGRARAGDGPSLVELKTYRVRSFAEGAVDPRDPQEIEAWKQRDPIEAFRRRLMEKGVLTEEAVARIQEDAQREMEAARAFAEESPFPEPAEAFEDLYA
jgi:TPP-dependent pyruvate/acetoin dehydrogenase alpha subunit